MAPSVPVEWDATICTLGLARVTQSRHQGTDISPIYEDLLCAGHEVLYALYDLLPPNGEVIITILGLQLRQLQLSEWSCVPRSRSRSKGARP